MKTTINHKGVDLAVEYVYSPSEKPVYYDSDLAGYPGCEAMAEIISIHIKLPFGSVDATNLLECQFEEIENIILKEHEYQHI